VVAWQKAEQERVEKLRRSNRIQELTALGMEEREGNYCFGPVIVNSLTITLFNDDQWTIALNQVKEDIDSHKQQLLAEKQSELEEAQFFGTEEDKQALNQEIQQLSTPSTVSLPSLPVASATKVKGITRRWVFEVTDTNLVPREYLMVDEKKVREAVAAGTRSIEGIRIYQDESLTIR
jgi:hypothetical protein